MSAPPTWSTDDLYAGFADPAFVADFERLMGCGTALGEVIDRHGIRGTTPRAATAADLDAAAEVVALLDAANDLGRTLYAFIDAYLRIDVTDETAGGLMARLGALMGSNRGQMARFAAWLGEVNVAATAATDPRLAVHAGWLDHLSRRARHQMSEAEETLAAELAASGSAAWTNLHAATTGRLEVEVALPGGRRRMPLAEARGLATHADPAVREAAYRAEMEGWPPVLPLCAAALNGVKGEAAVV